MKRLAFLCALTVACVPDHPPSGGPLAPSFDVTAQAALTGTVFGPDGSSICNFLPDPNGSVFRTRPIDPATRSFAAGVRFMTCPGHSFSYNLAPGNYLLRTQFIDDPPSTNIPLRELEHFTVDAAGSTHDVHVDNGQPLGGAATFQGAPLPGVLLTFTYDEIPGFLAADGISTGDGSWSDDFRPPMILQTGIRYQDAGGCQALGVKVLEGPPASFLFPTEVSSINCTFDVAPSSDFAHTHTRVVVTPMPGEFGGQATSASDLYGLGWGVQFPVGPGQSPVHTPVSATHLFGGGLLIGIAPERILSGINVNGQIQCPVSCQDFGQDATLHFTPETAVGRKVTWRYSDAGSPEGVGLRVMQRSYDGQNPNDYVLFQFRIQNASRSSLTFYAGTFMDWDVDDDASDDVGSTDMDGRLMSVSSAFESGITVGDLQMGAPISGTAFYDPGVDGPFTTAWQFEALSGGHQNTTTEPIDVHYLHGMGPITLKRGQQVALWIAIVAGENREQFLANARAAAADIERRQGEVEDPSDGPLTVTVTRSSVPIHSVSKGQVLQ